MVISRVYFYGFLLRISVYSLPFLAFGLSSYVRFGSPWFPHSKAVVTPNYLILLLVTELAWILAADYYKLSSITNLFWEHTGIRAAFMACCATFFVQNVLLAFARELSISRLFVVYTIILLFLCMVGTRTFFRVSSASTAWPRKSEKVLVVGTDQFARRAVKLLRRVPFARCDIQGYLQLPGQPVLVEDAPVISTAEPFRPEALAFDEVVVAIPPERYMQASSFVDSLESLGKPVRAILDLGPRLSLHKKLFQVGRLQVMSLAIFPVESFAYTVLKRAFDLLFAALGLLVFSPVFLVIALIVRLSSPGPILFRQERVGRHGEPFILLKFRTMHCNSKKDGDTTWTTRNDPRCTAIGTALRKFSLDELPQLWNVIRGEMSLVGPRPERPHFVAKFRTNIQKYNMRHRCQVGMTGWAQVNGYRGDTSIADRLQYDLYYLRNWSLLLDLQRFSVGNGATGSLSPLWWLSRPSFPSWLCWRKC